MPVGFPETQCNCVTVTLCFRLHITNVLRTHEIVFTTLLLSVIKKYRFSLELSVACESTNNAGAVLTHMREIRYAANPIATNRALTS